MDYLKLTLEKIEKCTSEIELAAIEAAVNNLSLNWSEGDKLTVNARIRDVREFWGLLHNPEPPRPTRCLLPIRYKVGQLVRHKTHNGVGLFRIESFGSSAGFVMVNCISLKPNGEPRTQVGPWRFDQDNVKPVF